MSCLYLAATKKSSGKTTISIGLCAALSERGLNVQSFKKGPDYIDPMWLSRASNNPCYNLDFNTMTDDEIEQTFSQYSQSADISLIEGNKGLFDGIDLEGHDSNSALAAQLNVPVILVIDAEGITRGIAPLLQGYQAFDKSIEIAGVILNNLGGSRHESKLRKVIEHYTDLEVLGAMQRNKALAIEERHLGLVTDREAPQCEQHIALIKGVINDHVNIARVIELANQHKIPKSKTVWPNKVGEIKSNIKIGIPRDNAFCFYYPDDLSAMEEQGAELHFFNALQDQTLPEVDALFIGGGFPETHAAELAQNQAMQNAIKRVAESGKSIYAECGGLMYLTRSITWKDQTYPMVGAIPADTIMHDKPIGRGLVELETTKEHPWHSVNKATIKAHEFHYSTLENSDPTLHYAYHVKRGHGTNGQQDGIVYNNIFASYTHQRNTQSNPWVSQFISHIVNQQP